MNRNNWSLFARLTGESEDQRRSGASEAIYTQTHTHTHTCYLYTGIFTSVSSLNRRIRHTHTHALFIGTERKKLKCASSTLTHTHTHTHTLERHSLKVHCCRFHHTHVRRSSVFCCSAETRTLPFILFSSRSEEHERVCARPAPHWRTSPARSLISVCLCVGERVCVWVSEWERDIKSVCDRECVCVCEKERHAWMNQIKTFKPQD